MKGHRRDFLKVGAVGLAAASTGGLGLAPASAAPAPGAHPFGQRYVKRAALMMFNLTAYTHLLLADFLAAGGLGLLIGDGRLNYGTERILETYYSIGVTKQTTVSFDYQFITNPAYNTDRGPVSVFSARLHAEF